MDTKHTPTPWHVVDGTRIKDALMPFDRDEGDCKLIAVAYGNPSSRSMPSDEQAEANAAFIVRAVNSHGQLTAALQELTHEADMSLDYRPEFRRAIATARAALAAAEA